MLTSPVQGQCARSMSHFTRKYTRKRQDTKHSKAHRAGGRAKWRCCRRDAREAESDGSWDSEAVSGSVREDCDGKYRGRAHWLVSPARTSAWVMPTPLDLGIRTSGTPAKGCTLEIISATGQCNGGDGSGLQGSLRALCGRRECGLRRTTSSALGGAGRAPPSAAQCRGHAHTHHTP